MKNTCIVSPWEFREFAETLGHSHDEACSIVSYIQPEYEVRTRDFNLRELLDEDMTVQEADSAGEELDEYSYEYEQRERTALIAFMQHHNILAFTMTQ